MSARWVSPGLLCILAIGLLGVHSGAAADDAQSGKARLTITLQYDESHDSHETSPSPGTGKAAVHVEATFQQILSLARVDGMVVANEIPPEQLSLRDKPGGRGEIEYRAEESSSGAEVSRQSGAAFHAVVVQGAGGGLAQYGNDDLDARDWGVALTLNGAASGACKTVTRSQERDSIMQPFHWVTRTDASCPVGMLDAIRNIEPISAADAKADPVHNQSGEVNLRFTVLPESDHAKHGDSPDTWYGAKVSGDAKAGFTLNFDGKRESRQKEAASAGDASGRDTAHLHVAATLTPLSPPNCTLDAGLLHQAFDAVLAQRHLVAPAEFLVTRQSYPQTIGYAVRLTRDDALLPSQNWIRSAAIGGAPPQAGAAHLLVGSIELEGRTFRVRSRIIDVSTAAVLAAGKANGVGCERGLEQALAGALSALPLRSYDAQAAAPLRR